MNCRDIKKLLSEYIDGDLGEKENWLVSEHLKICANCSKELDLLKETVSLLKIKEPVEPPADFVVQVRKKIERRRWWKEAVKVIFYPLHIKIPAEAIATVVVVCILYYVYQQPSPVKPGRELMENIAPTKATITKSETQKPAPVPMPEPELAPEPAPALVLEPAPESAPEPTKAQSPAPVSSLTAEISKAPRTTQIAERMEIAERGGKRPLGTDYIKSTKEDVSLRGKIVKEFETEKMYGDGYEFAGVAEGFVQRGIREAKISPEQIELLLILKNPKKDILKIKKYISILGAKKIGESYNEAEKEKIIIIQVNRNNYLELTKKLIQIGAIEPQDVKETEEEIFAVRLKIK